MKAAALSGHAGAQVAVNGEGALGARVQASCRAAHLHQAHTPATASRLQCIPPPPAVRSSLHIFAAYFPPCPACPWPLQVWWEGDQCFYSGILALYDAVSTE